ncbi:ABC transporter ATP-binding protein [Nocardia takedensis]
MRRHRDPATAHHRSPGGYLRWLAYGLTRHLVLGSLFATACMAAQALTPYAIGRAIDEGVTAGDRSRIAAWAAVLFGLAVTQVVAGVFRHHYGTSVRFTAAYRTVEELTRRIAVLGSALSRRTSSGEVVSVGVTDINSVGNALNVMLRGSSAVVAIALVSVLMLITSGRLALVVLIGVPIVVTAMGMLIRPLHHRSAVLRDRQTAMTDRAVDMVAGLRIIRGIGGEETFARRYREESAAVRRAGSDTAKVEALAKAAEVFLPGLLVVAIVHLGIDQIRTGRMSPGELVTFYGYAIFLIVPLTTLTEVINKVVKGFVAARRVVRILALEPEPDDETGDAEPAGLALVDPDSGLVAGEGIMTAVVCVRAADATTLLARLGRHTESAVSLGGVPLRDLPQAEARRRVLVSTDAARLFAGPLREELDPGQRNSGLSDAIRAASADDLIDALPEGLDTVLTGDGREFSGGQRQRLRLVRALMAAPDVLILAEPTSALDAHTEERVATGLRGARLDRSTVVFTTSPALLGRADVVVLVDAGRVVRRGRHRDLLTDQRYSAMVGRGEQR